MPADTDFKMIPDQRELAALTRTAEFVAARNDNPTVLSRDQIEAFNRDGFISGIRIFNDDEIAEHRSYFDRLLDAVVAAGGDSYSISSAHLKYSRVWDLLTHERIVAAVADLLGDDLIGWGSHYFCKLPRDGKTVAWHQDFSYWPLSASRTVTVWLAIDDADRDNACMQFLPGSHLQGLVGFRDSGDGENNVLNQTIDDIEQFRPPVDIELHDGEISLHSDLLIHGSGANHSDRRRCGLTLRYCPAEVRAALDWDQKGVVVRGSDLSGHWANVPRPAAGAE